MDPADSASRQLSLLAEEAGWEKNVLRRAFLNSLNENIKRELATKELPKSLSALINLCISLDDYMQEVWGWAAARRGRRCDDGVSFSDVEG